MRFLVLAAVWIASTFVFQANAQTNDIETVIDEQTERVTRLAIDLTESDVDLIDLREQLATDRARTGSLEDRLYDREAALRADLDRLGDPIDGEAPSVTERRDALNDDLTRMEKASAQLQVNQQEITRLLTEIAQARRSAFYNQLLNRRPAVFMKGELSKAFSAFQTGANEAKRRSTAWFSAQSEAGTLARTLGLIAAAFIFALLMNLPVRSWANRRISQTVEAMEPIPSRRILVAALRTLVRAAPAIVGGLVFYQALILLGVIDQDSGPFARAIWSGFIWIMLVDGAASAVLATRSPKWRVISVGSKTALRMRFVLVSAAIVVAADRILREGALLFGGATGISSLEQTIVAVLLALLLMLACSPRVWRPEEAAEGEPETTPSRKGGWIRTLLSLLGGASIIAALIGYAPLAHFAMTRIWLGAGVVGAAFAVRALLHEGIRLLDRRFASKHEGEGERLVSFWIGAFLDIVVFALALPPLFLLFGSDWTDVRATAIDALVGFQIGSVRISILELLFAVGVFAAVLAATRFIQRSVEKNVFPRTRMDIGVQNSLKTLIGYIGLVVAFMTGVGMLGFDLSNLAIIAGALSVGIGFGLQSIVNNFVSGLILLFERPIKVGDWVVTASGEGIVKRISVRSTEVETFDRASIIIPNSELISGTVTNWTHKNKLARITVAVGVSYNEDPDRIIDILRTVAKEADLILAHPEPMVLFVGFGDSSLDFEIRAFLSDVHRTLLARTQVRVAIFKAFKEAGVEIPFPQRDLHVRSSAISFGPPVASNGEPD
ncbi:MAG: mechanosensitive ion channel domain-containing protein [Pseudomonadota bacterium]